MFAASKSGSAVAKDPQFNYVTMLLHGNGTNGAQNNTFVDSSTNNFTITRNGNTTQGTFTPYGSNWSNYFDGSSYLNAGTNAAFAVGTGDFTIEFWVYPTSFSGVYTGYFTTRTGGQGFDIQILNATSTLMFGNSTGPVISANNVLSLNTWQHICAIRSGSTNSLYVNGTRVATGTDSTNFTDNGAKVCSSGPSGGNNGVGYISNLRLVKGTAVYNPSSSTITVPTTPLTAISGTSLLTTQSNRFIDNSTNAFAITVNGSPSVQRFSPFSPTTAYSTSVIGGSGYFDGSGDYLTAAQNAAFNIGTGQFTVECFIYWNGTTLPNGGYGLINLGNGANGGGPYTGWGLILDFDSGGKPTFYRYDGTVYSYQSSTNPTANQWIHLAVSRNSSNTLSIWMNGTRVYTGTVTTSFNNVNTDPLNIGYRQDGGTGGTHYFPGYISNARVVVGTDVYGASNSTITVPTAPLTAVSNTQFLLSTTNAGILDNAMMNDLETVGNAQISTSVKKYGTGSIALDGTGDALYSTSQATIFNTGNFTIEFWIYFNAVNNATTKFIYDMRNSGATSASFLAQETDNSWTYWNGAGTQISTGFTSSTFSATTWTHVAICRSSGTTKFFVNGTQTNSVADTSNYANSTIVVGARYNYVNELNAYIDDLRITKGVARYTANFTAPTAAFPDKG